MKITRYEIRSPYERYSGILTSEIDISRAANKLGISKWRYLEIRDESLEWLYEPEQPGEYWFTELGNKLFRERTLSLIEIALLPGSLIEKVEWEVEDRPIYEDKYQVCF